MKNLFIKLNILLLNPVIRLIVYLMAYTVIYITLCPSVLAMEQDRDTVKGILDAARDGDNQLLNILTERLRNITDSERIARINTLLEQLSIQYGVPIDTIQGTDTLTIANSGLPPAQDSIDWRNVLLRTAIFVGASAIVYLMYRNFHHFTDLFSDVSETIITNIDYARLFQGIRRIIRHSPEARNAFLNEPLIRELLQQGFDQSPPSA